MRIVNGIKTENAHIALDDGYQFGKGVFETICVTNQPLFLKEHLKRLNEGLEKLSIKQWIEEASVIELIQNHDIRNCALKIIVSDDNVVLTTRPNPYAKQPDREGFKCKMGACKRNSFSYTTYLKTLNYTDNLLERELAKKEGYDEVLFLNTENELAEGSTTNVFFVKGDTLYTPDISCGLLNGIIRQWICEHYKVKEGRYSLTELYHSDGAFLTNSLMGIIKIHSVEEHRLSDTNRIKEIQKRYAEEILNH